MEHDLAERQRESAVQFQQSCDFSADTPPATPDVVTPRTMRPSPEFVYDPDTSDTGTLLTCRFFLKKMLAVTLPPPFCLFFKNKFRRLFSYLVSYYL